MQHHSGSGIATAMAVYHLFDDEHFDTEQIEAMSLALRVLSNDFGLQAHDEPLRRLIASAIMTCVRRGVRGRCEIRKCASEILKDAA